MDGRTAVDGAASAAAGSAVRPLEITVLTGGPGSEREVSLASGAAVAEALVRAGHAVQSLDITPADTSALDREGVDVVFIALHGPFGEDGQVQRLCERRRLPYVGSGPDASAMAMDKNDAKRVYQRAGLLTPDWTVVEADESADHWRASLRRFSPPCVVKPVDSGSSVDITIAHDLPARDAAVADLLHRYGRVMVECFIAGRELTVGVLGDRALPVVEIRPEREFYDYQAKYIDDATEYIVPADLPADVARCVSEAGSKAHAALGCRDLSRTDFLLTSDGTPWVLETNTIPGFTSHSLVPKAAAAAGVDFPTLCDRLVRMALHRAGR
ncbi:MAG TPA: D-alanine--D-alanine ligase [Phycisphaerae bacterium]|nr:D-alanine--D-alanine ligase [Phycisphaerae bacterium]